MCQSQILNIFLQKASITVSPALHLKHVVGLFILQKVFYFGILFWYKYVFFKHDCFLQDLEFIKQALNLFFKPNTIFYFLHSSDQTFKISELFCTQ